VFNDILTGKDTNQPSEDINQPAHSPFRADPAATDLECPGCRQLFPAAQAVQDADGAPRRHEATFSDEARELQERSRAQFRSTAE
jgi:hypothetical protein